MKSDYLENLPAVPLRMQVQHAAQVELGDFITQWAKTHELTPSERFLLLSDEIRLLATLCVNGERSGHNEARDS